MKSRISYSRFSIIITTILMAALFIGCILTVKEKPAFFSLLAIYIILIVSALLFGPVFIKTDSHYIVLGSPVSRKKIPIAEVESVELFQPTMDAVRIFASGGFMGYWGKFREGDIGNYYGFYGKASDCFLVRTNTGKKYVLGCNNPAKMVEYIKSQGGTGK